MRRIITTSLLFLTLLGGVAMADRDGRRGDRDRGRGGRDRVVVRNPGPSRPIVRQNNRPVVRQDNRRVYRGQVRADRRRIDRRITRVDNGGFRFHNNVVVRYQRPVIRQHYYDVRYRPQIIVESYPQQSGYVWVSGQWAWDGYEWQWQSGYYAPDPQFQVYYDDGSWE